MEDKQIYSSARSEEIKRQLIALRNKVKKALAGRAKKQKEEKSARDFKSKVSIQPQTKGPKEKPQNIQLSSEDSKSTNADKVEKTVSKNKQPFLDISTEKLFPFFVYTLFAIIIIIVALGIFLT